MGPPGGRGLVEEILRAFGMTSPVPPEPEDLGVSVSPSVSPSGGFKAPLSTEMRQAARSKSTILRNLEGFLPPRVTVV